jgi:hypothetical protein
MRKRTVLYAVLAAVLLTGCSGESGSTSSVTATDSVESSGWNFATDSVSGTDPAGADSSTSQETDYSQKLVWTYDCSMETTAFDDSYTVLCEKTREYGGYVESTNLYGTGTRHAYLTVRIPADSCEEFLSSLSDAGEIISQSSSSRDITSDYYDAQARLDSLNAQHERLLELMDMAESLNDIVTLQDQLSTVEYQLDTYESMMNVYKNQVSYATVDFSLTEVAAVSPLENESFFSRAWKGFRQNCSGAFDIAEGLLLWFLTNIPYFLLFGTIIFLVTAVIRKVKKAGASRRRKRTMVHMPGPGGREHR